MNNAEEKTERQKALEEKRLAKLAKFQAKQDKQAKEKQEAEARKQVNAEAKAKAPKAPVEEIVYPETPLGHKKLLSEVMAPTYSPKAVEASWYAWWETQGFFKPEAVLARNPDAEPYTIATPPPNVTGSLHLGHAMGLSIQDTLIRWQRMKGRAALFLPGCDHAGISCQVVVEKQLWKTRQVTRHDLGREQFLREVWQWKDTYGSRIYEQFKKMGASLDWTRATFTLDEKYNNAVRNAFVQLFEDGIIYRDNRLVNWSGKLQTTVSDLEVDYVELTGKTLRSAHGHDPAKQYAFGQLYDVAYVVLGADGKPTDREIVVSTTRPETIPGDVAVAVNAKDPRYTALHGAKLAHPLTGAPIPLILDDIADMTFGTGAVKITPAHDPNDFAVGHRHALPFIDILTDDNKISENAGIPELIGLMRFDARERIVALLEARGLLRGIGDHAMTLPICNRSGDVIEPRLRPQWWLKCDTLAKRSADAVRNGDMALLPKESEKVWFHWLDNCKDWCLSRQLWWGHQIPAYEIRAPGNVLLGWQAGHSAEDAFARLQAKGKVPAGTTFAECSVRQDPDVFDTWFSAALWPLVTLGWQGGNMSVDSMPDFEKFFPTSLLETGRDIIFFWVARMTMFSLYFVGRVPFSTVFLHSMVRDAHGRKMSKSLGNVIDPLDVISGITLDALHAQLRVGNLDPKEVQIAVAGQKKDFPNGIAECGTDALRFAMCAYTSPGADVNLDIARVEGYRKFCNKLWNAARFVMTRLDTVNVPESMSLASMDLFSRWILGRASEMVKELDAHLADFNFLKATSVVHAFFLYDFCDVYIEVTKRLDTPAAYYCLHKGLFTALLALHPFMPYVTEELYQRLNSVTRTTRPVESISLEAFPVPFADLPLETDEDVAVILDLVKQLRILSKEIKGPFKALIHASDAHKRALLGEQETAILALTKNLKEISFSEHADTALTPLDSIQDIAVALEKISL